MTDVFKFLERSHWTDFNRLNIEHKSEGKEATRALFCGFHAYASSDRHLYNQHLN
ncbi:hypothetical protein [Tumidithrix elongata]|uniref:hypothetical protein n=1 Tax=Tumidithrix elongata TaxID=3088357 RepID=UPI002ED191DD